MDPDRALASITADLEVVATPERAAGEKRYLKSDLDFMGAPMGAIRTAVGRVLREERDLRREDVLDLARAAWGRPVHELRMAAVLALQRSAGMLDETDLPRLEVFLRDAKTWALVDVLAIGVAGVIVRDHPGATTVTDRWARDEDFWIRRSALLSQLPALKAGGSFDAFARYADAMLEEKEFFVRKAIGWVLRDVSKKRPDEVWAWLAPRAHRASGVTMREAVKYLGEPRARRLMERYRSRSPLAAG